MRKIQNAISDAVDADVAIRPVPGGPYGEIDAAGDSFKRKVASSNELNEVRIVRSVRGVARDELDGGW